MEVRTRTNSWVIQTKPDVLLVKLDDERRRRRRRRQALSSTESCTQHINSLLEKLGDVWERQGDARLDCKKQQLPSHISTRPPNYRETQEMETETAGRGPEDSFGPDFHTDRLEESMTEDGGEFTCSPYATERADKHRAHLSLDGGALHTGPVLTPKKLAGLSRGVRAERRFEPKLLDGDGGGDLWADPSSSSSPDARTLRTPPQLESGPPGGRARHVMCRSVAGVRRPER
ncbi:unnamed protein product [Pleuronectes platessa]|uniref:Uncharacterized protein n=1 Tax=Pleuronectes platessa TaxID=8262 RepID=A0A9N7TPM6_PLEPL|nr:unnamed protein product [Pleuronectes platessa]